MLNQGLKIHSLNGNNRSRRENKKQTVTQNISGLSGAWLVVALLLSLTSSPNAHAVILSNINPILTESLQNYTQSPVFTLIPPGSTQVSRNTTISSPTINLSGSLTDTDAGVSYTIGTSRSSNPAFGLDFFAKGTATFDYLWPVTINHDAPERVAPGQNFTINPYVELTATDPSMNVSQDIAWGTEFFSSYKKGPVDYEFSIALPDITPSSTISLNLSGNDSMNSISSSFSDESPPNRNLGSGVGTVTTDSTEIDAWSVTADLLNIVNRYVPLDPISTVAVAAADLIFDLDLTLGLDIHREDKLTLWGFDFSDSNGYASSPVTISTPDDLVAGDIFNYGFDSRLSYNASITSLYYYGGQASLILDPILVSPWEIGASDFGNQLVGVSQLSWNDLETPVSLFGQTRVNDGRCNSDGAFCFFFSDLNPLGGSALPTIIGSPPTVQPGNTAQIDYNPTNIPEPATWSLMVLGLLGIIRRKKSNLIVNNVSLTAT